MPKRPKVEGFIISKKYEIQKFVAGGSFGALFSGINQKTKEVVAIKLEAMDAEAPQLGIEFRFYVLLGKHSGIPQIYDFAPCGPFGRYNAIVMEMLGPSLDSMHVLCKKRFSVSTTARIGQQIISIMEWVHSKHIIFRDTKPENFLLGREGTPKADLIHIIDFGLAKEYINRETGEHIPDKTGKSLIGTPRYMSVWSHSGLEQSRRDDMLSIGYLLIYLMRGWLPWMGLKLDRIKKYKRIGELKRETSPETLCNDVPKPFLLYMQDVTRLQFFSKPNYKQLSDYLKPLIDNKANYEWRNTISHINSDSSNETVGQKTVK